MRCVKSSICILAAPFVIASMTCAANAQTPSPSSQVSPSPTEFVEIAILIARALDLGQAGQIWDNASPVMKTIVSRDQFANVAQQRRATRGALSDLTWRSVIRVQMQQPQGQLPAGNYLTVNIVGINQDGRPIVETVSFMLDDDQNWRLIGISQE